MGFVPTLWQFQEHVGKKTIICLTEKKAVVHDSCSSRLVPGSALYTVVVLFRNCPVFPLSSFKPCVLQHTTDQPIQINIAHNWWRRDHWIEMYQYPYWFRVAVLMKKCFHTNIRFHMILCNVSLVAALMNRPHDIVKDLDIFHINYDNQSKAHYKLFSAKQYQELQHFPKI